MANNSKKNVKKKVTKKDNKVSVTEKTNEEHKPEVKRFEKKSTEVKAPKGKFWENNKGTVIVLGIVLLLVIMTVLVEGNQKETEIDYSTLGSDIQSWNTDTHEDKYVISVIALSTCGYCAQYKPIITKIANENDIKLYWFEIDTMEEADANALQNTYALEQYSGSSPYTFITKNGEFVKDTIGYMPEEDTITFLTEAGVLK